MLISKEFKWEMGHRLPRHNGACKNVHGHSYRLRVEIEGEPNEEGMVIDFHDISAAVKPLIAELDHAFLCEESDVEMLQFLRESAVTCVVVATKHDKVRPSKRHKREREFAAKCELTLSEVVWVSAENGHGVPRLREVIREVIREAVRE